MEEDVCSKHEIGRLPVLDLEVYVANGQVHHCFYKKPMSTPYLILYRSALSKSTKRNGLLQEGMRRLRNCSKSISTAEKCQILSKFMWACHISGYDHQYRYTLLEGILKRHEQIEAKILAGTRVKFRSQEQILEFKEGKLGKHKNTWFLTDSVVSTIKVTATPGERLKGEIDQTLRSRGTFATGGMTKVVELGGKPIFSGLSKSQNFGGQGSRFLGPPKCNVTEDHDSRLTRCI